MTKNRITTLIENNKPLIPYFIKLYFSSYPPPGYTENECQTLGMSALFLAARRWEKAKGAFATYARYWIFHVFMKDMKKRTHAVSIGMRTQDRMQRIKKYCRKKEIAFHSSNEKLMAELREYLGLDDVSFANTVAALERSGRGISLHRPACGDDDTLSMIETIDNESALWHEPGGCFTDPAEQLAAKDSCDKIRRRLTAELADRSSPLNHKKKELLARIVLHGESVTAAGRALGLSRAAAHIRFRRMLETLRPIFEDLQ